jgi:hypothetical protein
VHLALGALIIKEKLNITDRETVERIKENHYLQFLIGRESFDQKNDTETTTIPETLSKVR